MRPFVRTVVVVAILALVGCGSSGGSTSTSGNAGNGGSSSTSSSIEYKLASLDAGEPLDPSDPRVAEYSDALDALESKCKQSRKALADFSVKATQLLAKKGVDLSNLKVIQHVSRSMPKAAPTLDCADTFAAFVTLTSKP